MFLIVAKYLIPNGYRGIALFPFVILRDSVDKCDLCLINHEKIHIRQQLELLVLPFYVIYFMDYGIKLIRFRDKNRAYREIFFEREAYANEKDLDYLKSRSHYSFWKYINF